MTWTDLSLSIRRDKNEKAEYERMKRKIVETMFTVSICVCMVFGLLFQKLQ